MESYLVRDRRDLFGDVARAKVATHELVTQSFLVDRGEDPDFLGYTVHLDDAGCNSADSYIDFVGNGCVPTVVLLQLLMRCHAA